MRQQNESCSEIKKGERREDEREKEVSISLPCRGCRPAALCHIGFKFCPMYVNILRRKEFDFGELKKAIYEQFHNAGSELYQTLYSV